MTFQDARVPWGRDIGVQYLQYIAWTIKNQILQTIKKKGDNNNNASVFILRRLHPDDNERVITTLWTEVHYI